ncbi:MAG: ATP-binding protein [Bacteroidales bacterium]|nr:ATP-binding protein [Bacteroidales bacterium]HRX32190.1 ATP-binding protein [Tenuifilaceae bacterium]
MSKYIANLISQGEHLTLDFKHSITDSRKIARSLVAFANTAGGTLLIGVKDNGNIAGVNSDEEFYMVEAASQLYCKPEVPFEVVKWNVDGKTVLEVKIELSKKRPHKAPDKNGKFKAYIRVADENVIASAIQVKIWKAERHRKSISLNLSDSEQKLMAYLRQKESITVEQFSRLGFLSYAEAEQTLVNLTVIGMLIYRQTGDSEIFCLGNE